MSPRVQIVTDSGEVIGIVPVNETNVGTKSKPRYGHGWDGSEFERLWRLAQSAEELARQKAESEEAP